MGVKLKIKCDRCERELTEDMDMFCTNCYIEAQLMGKEESPVSETIILCSECKKIIVRVDGGNRVDFEKRYCGKCYNDLQQTILRQKNMIEDFLYIRKTEKSLKTIKKIIEG